MTFECMKCGNDSFESNEFRATGGIFSKLFDVQNRKFTTVSCKKCSFVELYKGDSSKLDSVVDFLGVFNYTDKFTYNDDKPQRLWIN